MKKISLLICFANVVMPGLILAQINTVASTEKTKQLADSQQIILLQEKAKKFYPEMLDSMLIYLDQSIALSEKIHWDERIADAYIEQSKAYYVKGKYYLSLEVATKAAAIYQQYKNDKGLAATYNTIGAIYAVLEEFQISAGYHRKSIEMAKISNDSSMIARNYFNLSICYESLNTDSALFFVNNAIAMYIPLKDSVLLAMAYNRRGETHFNRQEIKAAIRNYEYTLAHFSNLNNWEKSFSYSGLAKSYQHLGNYQKSIEYGEKAYSIVTSINAAWDIWNITKILSESYAQHNEYAKAYSMLQEYSRLNDSIYNADKNNQINFLLVKQKELENKELQAKTEAQLSKIHNKNYQMFIVLAGLFTLLFFSANLFRQNKRKKRTNEALLHLNNEIAHQQIEITDTLLKIKELSAFKKSMNAMIVHDMKNLLNVVIHMGQSDMAVYAGKSMLNMVNNILDIEKFESTSIKLNKELVKSEQLVHDAIKEIEYSMQMKNISISNKSEENCHIQVDRNLINRVIVNLLTNAIKFSPEKSTITIKANCTEKLYTLSIQDEGEGIETSQLNKIFEKYYQANAKDYDSVRSTGLGLSFSKMAVEAHKGSIRAESVFGKGAKFIVELPLS